MSFSPHDAGLAAVRALQVAEDGAWTSEEAPIPAATLDQMRKECKVVHWRANDAYHYPKWQFDAAGRLLPGIQDVPQIFKSNDEWRVMRYFLGQRRQLDERRPLDLLRTGEVDRVLAHARIHVAANTW